MSRMSPVPKFLSIYSDPNARIKRPELTDEANMLLVGEENCLKKEGGLNTYQKMIKFDLFRWIHDTCFVISDYCAKKKNYDDKKRLELYSRTWKIFHATVTFFDTWLNSNATPGSYLENLSSNLELDATTSIFVINKFYGADVLKAKTLSYYVEPLFEKEINVSGNDIIKSEEKMLKKLKYKILTPTVEVCFSALQDKFFPNENSSIGDVKFMQLLLDTAVFDDDLFNFNPYILAATVITTVSRITENDIISYILKVKDGNDNFRDKMKNNLNLCVRLFLNKIKKDQFKENFEENIKSSHCLFQSEEATVQYSTMLDDLINSHNQKVTIGGKRPRGHQEENCSAMKKDAKVQKAFGKLSPSQSGLFKEGGMGQENYQQAENKSPEVTGKSHQACEITTTTPIFLQILAQTALQSNYEEDKALLDSKYQI